MPCLIVKTINGAFKYYGQFNQKGNLIRWRGLRDFATKIDGKDEAEEIVEKLDFERKSGDDSILEIVKI